MLYRDRCPSASCGRFNQLLSDQSMGKLTKRGSAQKVGNVNMYTVSDEEASCCFSQNDLIILRESGP